MNILIFNWRDLQHPLAGGAEISLFEHAKHWQKKGAKITWFASYFPGAKKVEEKDGMIIMRAGSHFTTVLYAFYYYIIGKFGKQDIVVDCFHFIPFFTPLYMRSIKKIALINEVAGKVWYLNLPFLLAVIGYYVEPIFFVFYKKVTFITASDSAKNDLIKVGIAPRNISIVQHGIITEKISLQVVKENNPTILFLNRISKDKGIEDALEAFTIVKSSVRDLMFWIVGKEEISGVVKNILHKKGLQLSSPGIKYFGFVDQKKKFELLKKATLLIHPSKKEGWGLTVIEAASQGTPTVGYNVEGLRDSIQDMKTGLLVKDNPESLAQGISMLIANSKLRQELGTEAIKWAKTFNWKKNSEKSWRIIQSVYEN